MSIVLPLETYLLITLEKQLKLTNGKLKLLLMTELEFKNPSMLITIDTLLTQKPMEELLRELLTITLDTIKLMKWEDQSRSKTWTMSTKFHLWLPITWENREKLMSGETITTKLLVDLSINTEDSNDPKFSIVLKIII